MLIRFNASQNLQISVTEESVPIQHYLKQPQRLVKALVDPKQISQVGEDLFCLKMRPISFLYFTLQPTVYLKVWVDGKGCLNLRSTGCEIRGIEYINQRFDLALVGKLSAQKKGHEDLLLGRAELEVQVELPPALWFTPKPILETAGNGLLKSVLLTMKQRLSHQLIADYKAWVKMVKMETEHNDDKFSQPWLNGSIPE
jgi:hypothetical protein